MHFSVRRQQMNKSKPLRQPTLRRRSLKVPKPLYLMLLSKINKVKPPPPSTSHQETRQDILHPVLNTYQAPTIKDHPPDNTIRDPLSTPDIRDPIPTTSMCQDQDTRARESMPPLDLPLKTWLRSLTLSNTMRKRDSNV